MEQSNDHSRVSCHRLTVKVRLICNFLVSKTIGRTRIMEEVVPIHKAALENSVDGATAATASAANTSRAYHRALRRYARGSVFTSWEVLDCYCCI